MLGYKNAPSQEVINGLRMDYRAFYSRFFWIDFKEASERNVLEPLF